MASPAKRRVGVVGFGHLGEFMVDAIVNDPVVSAQLELAFVWNRSAAKVDASALVPPDKHCRDLRDFARFGADLIVEVAHPDITREFGATFVRAADYLVGSPTVFADRAVERSLLEAATEHGVYVPSGALWGAEDIRKMSDNGSLAALTVTMKKHPASLKVLGHLEDRVQQVRGNASLCIRPIAPQPRSPQHGAGALPPGLTPRPPRAPGAARRARRRGRAVRRPRAGAVSARPEQRQHHGRRGHRGAQPGVRQGSAAELALHPPAPPR